MMPTGPSTGRQSANEAIDTMRQKVLRVSRGLFAENLTTEGVDLKNLPIGTELKVGLTVRLKITQIGKKCHTKCAIFRKVGECIMPLEGVFAEVLESGTVKVGDTTDYQGYHLAPAVQSAAAVDCAVVIPPHYSPE